MQTLRRQLLIAAGTLLATPLARAQISPKLRRIGHLQLNPYADGVQKWWLAGLQQAGYEHGKKSSG
jgi:hypothetical protein